MAATGVTRTMLSPRAGLQLPNALVWHAGFARAVQELCVARKGTAKPARVVRAAITGHTTPALADVGCASVRLRFHVEGGDAVADGGYLVALRSYHQGSHRGSGRSTADSNLGRPIQMTSEGAPECDGITFLHNEALLQIFRVGDAVQVHLVARVQEFFLGLNAGTWLKIRMQQISDAAQDHVQQHHATQLAAMRSSTAEQVLRSGGLDMNRHVELPPADAAYLFDHWGAGGNSGVSGQRCLPSGVDPRTSPGGVGGEAAQVGQYVPWAYQPLGGGTAERGGCKAGNQRRESSAHLSSQAES